jgi:von Willebrand factor type A domain
VRIGLPLLVLTSLSLHIIALLIIMLTETSPRGSGRGHESEPPGAVVILSKEISPDRPTPPPSHAQPPPPPASALAQNVPHPAPPPETAPSAENILAGNGGPHLNGGVVFLLDISGSMYEAYAGATRLALARKFIQRQIEALPDGTPFAIAMYGETTRRSGLLVRATPASRTAAEQYLMEDFNCGGGTNLPAGFDTAEELHPASVVLVSDGDLNMSDHVLLRETKRILGEPGPQLSVFGIAPRGETYDAQQLEEIARQQAGSYHAMDVRH